MKSIVFLFIGALLISSLHLNADDKKDKKDKKEKDLPPGLQKKENLPPGWEKKRKSGETNSANADTPPAPPSDKSAPESKASAPAVPPKTPKELRGDLQKSLTSINAVSERPALRKSVMESISQETGVPLATLQAQHKNHPDMGLAGLFMGNLLAKQTGKPAGQFFKARTAGTGWMEIANKNNLDLTIANHKAQRISAAAQK